MFNYGRPPRRVKMVRNRPTTMSTIRMGISVVMLYKRWPLWFIVQPGGYGGAKPHIERTPSRRWGGSVATRPLIDKKKSGYRGAKPHIERTPTGVVLLFCGERPRQRPRKFFLTFGNFFPPLFSKWSVCRAARSRLWRSARANFSQVV